MAAVMKRCQRGREDRRKDKRRKHSHSRNKPKKSVCWCLTFFLLFVLPGAASLTLTGQKDSSITLPCNSSNTEELSTLLTFGSKIAYGSGQDKHFTGRVNESESCDLILHDLKTTDAGKYMSKVFANGQLLDRYTYDIRVDVNLTGRKDEELMFDELPREAESVEHFTNPDWTKVWRRRQGVLTDRLTDKNDRLTIKNFSSSDAGIYRVLNSSGGILLTVTVTESGSESKDKLDSAHELDGTEKNYIVIWVLLVVVVVMVVVIAFAVIIIKSRCQNRSNEHDSYQGVSTQETVQGPRSPNNTSGCLVGLH